MQKKLISKTMQDTETQISQFMVEGTEKFKYGKQLSIKYLGHVLFTIEMLVFILQLKNFLKNFVNSNFQRP